MPQEAAAFPPHALELRRRITERLDREALFVQGEDGIDAIEEALGKVRHHDQIDVAALVYAARREGAVEDDAESGEPLQDPPDQPVDPCADLWQAINIDWADAKHVWASSLV